MESFIVDGGVGLRGHTTLAGAKNVALKALVASILTDDQIILRNVPDIRDVALMLKVLQSLGFQTQYSDHTATVTCGTKRNSVVPLEIGARLRTSSMVLGPLLARYGEAKIPNPGGCRIGARPINRHIEALEKMGATIRYDSKDGFFHAHALSLHGTTIRFPKNTHTGTETILLAAVMAQGRTTIDNAAQEVEVDNLIALLTAMGAHIKRVAPRTIIVDGVTKLNGADFTIMPDRNEEITFAIAAALTDGKITVEGSQRNAINAFLTAFRGAGGAVDIESATRTSYSRGRQLKASDTVTLPHPGFMTDWQAPWAVLMTQAEGTSTIHETIFESRFSYVYQLQKMGANISFFDPKIENPQAYYNFNWNDHTNDHHQGIRIAGPTQLHNAILEMDDLRAGATLLLAALAAKGQSIIFGIEQIDRGYETIEIKLRKLGAKISRQTEDTRDAK